MLPGDRVALLAGVTVPTVKPALASAVVAAGCVNPTTFGTLTGPLLTARLIEVPGETITPGAILWLMTVPTGALVLLCIVTDPTTSFAPVSVLVAAACVIPTTFGVLTVATGTCGLFAS
jgi:hypothetical protein